MMNRSDGKKSWKGQSCICPGHRNGDENERLSPPLRSREPAKENPTDWDPLREVPFLSLKLGSVETELWGFSILHCWKEEELEGAGLHLE